MQPYSHRTLLAHLCLLLLSLKAFAEVPPTQITYAFTGEILEVDESLEKSVPPGWVLSGTLTFSNTTLLPVPDENPDQTRYENVLTQAEFTFDENYVLTYAGRFDETDQAFIEVSKRLETAGKSDYLRLVIPVLPTDSPEGAPQATWLEFFFWNTGGIKPNSEAIPLKDFRYQEAQARLTFKYPESADNLFVSAQIDQFEALEDEGYDSQQRHPQAELEAIILELNALIVEQRKTIRSLETQLDQAKGKIAALQKQVSTNPQNTDNQAANTAEIAALETTIQSLEKQLAKQEEAEIATQAIAAKNKSLQTANAMLIRTVREQETALSNNSQQTQESQKTIQELKSQLTQYENLVTTLRQTLEFEQTTAPSSIPSSPTIQPVAKAESVEKLASQEDKETNPTAKNINSLQERRRNAHRRTRR